MSCLHIFSSSSSSSYIQFSSLHRRLLSSFKIIAAVETKTNMIGVNGQIPFIIFEDREYFKTKTKDSILIMGRATWEESNIHLPHAKRTIVLSRSPELHVSIKSSQVSVASSFLEALTLAYADTSPVFVVGGEKVYEEALIHSDATELYLTHVEFPDSHVHSRENTVARFPVSLIPSFFPEVHEEFEGKNSGKYDDEGVIPIGTKYIFKVYKRI